MSVQKISRNADIVIQAMASYDDPVTLRTIAKTTGAAEIKPLEKHQVRRGVEDHLLPAGFVQEFEREENGTKVGYYALTEEGRARAEASQPDCSCECDEERVEELEAEVEELRGNVKDIASLLNDPLPEEFRKLKQDVSKLAKEIDTELKNTSALAYRDDYW